MRTTLRCTFLLGATISALVAAFVGCGTGTFSSASDAGEGRDAAVSAVGDAGSDVVIVVTHPDGGGVEGDGSAESGTDAGDDVVDAAPDHTVPTLDASDGSSSAVDAPSDATDATVSPEAGPDSGTDSAVPVTDASTDAAAEAAQVLDANPGVTVAGHAIADGQSGAVFTITPPISWSTTALSFRQIGLRDATGKLVTSSTDSNGAFQFSGVTPPYDVVVYPGDPTGWPYVYLGLSTPHPRLAGSVAVTPRTANVDVTVQFQDCGASTCQCALTYWFPTLAEQENVGCGNLTSGNLTQTWTTGIPWNGPASTTADLHVLEWDPQGQHYWHAVVSGVTLNQNQTTNVSQVVPSAIPSAGTLTVNASGNALPSNWTVQAGIGLNYPNGDGWVSLVGNATPPLTLGLPDIPGATVGASASATYAPSLLQETYVYAGSVPVTPATATVGLTVNAPVTLDSPPVNGSVSRSGVVAWTAAAPGEVYALNLVPVTNTDAGQSFGTTELWVFTSGSAVDLARVAALNVTVTPQSTWLELSGEGQVASLDAMVDEQTMAMPDGTQGSWVSVPVTITP